MRPIDDEPVRLMVIDTQGGDYRDEYQALLPGVEMQAVEPSDIAGTPSNPHGAWVGWLAAIPCVALDMRVELTFVRIFDGAARMIPTATQLIMDSIEHYRPHAITASWGMWDQDTRLGEITARTLWSHWAHNDLVPLLQATGAVWFAAAGNDDANDADADIAYPQAAIPEHVFVVGACDARGVPTPWSGDGDGVSCVMWADNVASPDGAGEWTRWRGTSAAAPKLAGAYLAGDCNTFEQFRGVIETLPDDYRPAGYRGPLPHPKWGWGCAEDLWQIPMASLPPHLLPRGRMTEPTVHDIREL